MSQLPRAVSVSGYDGSNSKNVRRAGKEGEMQEILSALDDADCHAILEATSGGALTANEISETCDLPLSTTYRKLDLLADVGFVEERTRIRGSGKHASEFVRSVSDVVVSLSQQGTVGLQISYMENSPKVASSLDDDRAFHAE